MQCVSLAHAHTNTYTHTNTHTHIYTHTFTYKCTYTRTYTHIHTHTHMHTHTHTHTHTYTQRRSHTRLQKSLKNPIKILARNCVTHSYMCTRVCTSFMQVMYMCSSNILMDTWYTALPCKHYTHACFGVQAGYIDGNMCKCTSQRPRPSVTWKLPYKAAPAADPVQWPAIYRQP